MLASEWSQGGRILWCGVRPLVKEQLNSILKEPLYCEPEEVRIFLTGNFYSNYSSKLVYTGWMASYGVRDLKPLKGLLY